MRITDAPRFERCAWDGNRGQLQRLYPKQFDPAKLLLLLGTRKPVQQLQGRVAPEKIVAAGPQAFPRSTKFAAKYFLYK